MEISNAERHLLIAAWLAHKRDRAGRTYDELRKSAVDRSDIDGDPVDPAPAFERLDERGWLLKDAASGRYTLSAAALAVARDLEHEHARKSFDEWMLSCERSATYTRVCERVYGLPFVQFGMIDTVQMTALVQAMAVRAGDRVVDLGCGVGTVTEHVGACTGAQVTGIDFAPGAIRRASERTRDAASRLVFQVGDLNRLDLPLASFDVVMALDTLYFVEDLPKVVEDIVALLRPGGRFLAFWDSVRRDEEPESVLLPESTRLALALTAHGCAFTTTEFTESEKRLWIAAHDAATELKGAFEAEGNLKLWKSLDWESSLMIAAHAAGKARRYLYAVRRA